jgi:hypothetical protein
MTRSTLRAALYIIGGLLVAGGIALAVIGCFPPAAGLALWGAILLIGLLIERWRYKPLAEQRPGPEWSPSIFTRRPASDAMWRRDASSGAAHPSRRSPLGS